MELTLDTALRVVEVPDDLQKALNASPAAAAAWETLSYSNRKGHVDGILSARGAETRARRIAAIVTKLV